MFWSNVYESLSATNPTKIKRREMNPPTRIEWIVILSLLAISTVINVKSYGWAGFFKNTNPLGYMVAAWIWCLVLHRK